MGLRGPVEFLSGEQGRPLPARDLQACPQEPELHSWDLGILAQHRGAHQDRIHLRLRLGLGSQTHTVHKSHTQRPSVTRALT